MPGFQDSLEKMYDTLETPNFSELIKYTSGAQSIVDMPASKGSSRYEVADFDGVRFRSYDSDWIFRAKLLNFGAGIVEPQRGDEITWIDANGFIHVYLVASQSEDPHFRYSDPFKIGLRVHTTEQERS